MKAARSTSVESRASRAAVARAKAAGVSGVERRAYGSSRKDGSLSVGDAPVIPMGGASGERKSRRHKSADDDDNDNEIEEDDRDRSTSRASRTSERSAAHSDEEDEADHMDEMAAAEARLSQRGSSV